MMRLKTVFHLEGIKTHPHLNHLLIVTSETCSYCQQFKSYWEEIAAGISDRCVTCHVEVEEVGGTDIFSQGVHYFLQQNITGLIGFPSFYVINYSQGLFSLVPTPIYWNREKREFMKQNLVDYLREELVP